MALTNNWSQIRAAYEKGKVEGLQLAGDKMVSIMIGKLNEPKGGKIYRGHQASAPGQSPATDSEALQDSLKAEMDGDSACVVYSDVEHSKHLEFGTSKMIARPMWAQAAEEMRNLAPEMIAKSIQSHLR